MGFAYFISFFIVIPLYYKRSQPTDKYRHDILAPKEDYWRARRGRPERSERWGPRSQHTSNIQKSKFVEFGFLDVGQHFWC